MKKILCIFGAIFFAHIVANGPELTFLTLADFQRFAKNFPENIPVENDNFIDPSYEQYHHTLSPTVWRSFLELIRLDAPLLVSQSYFKQLLETVVAQRKRRVNLEEHLMSLKIADAAHVIAWGDLKGAFHSWIRSLEDLKERGIIDDTLKIIKPEYYFCILGNVLDGSPYLIETMVLAITLLMKNPDRVFYLKGDFNEGRDSWRYSGLSRELTIRAPRIMENSKLIGDFLDSIPLALYVSGQDATNDVIRFSHTGTADERIDVEHMGNFFLHAQGEKLRRFFHKTTAKTKTENQVVVRAIVKGDPGKEVVARESKGLDLLEPDRGATAWLVRSCPTPIQQLFLRFFYDAYVDVAIGKTLEASTIALYNRDVRSNTATFSQAALYNIVSGQPLDVVSGETSIATTPPIAVGSSMSLTRGVAVMGQRTKRGMSVAIREINKSGGIRGSLIRPYVLDDEYVPRLARQNIQELISRYGIHSDLLPIGSPTLEAYLDLVRRNEMFVFFPVTGGPQFRDPALTAIIHFRPSYEAEARALMEYFVDEYGARKFAFFYQDDGYGKGPLNAAHDFLKDRGITQWLDVPYNRTDVVFKDKAQAIQAYQPDAIALFSTGNQTRELIRQLGIDTLVNKRLFGISFLAEENFKRFVRQRGLPIIFAHVVPPPAISELPIVQEYRAAMDAQQFPYDTFSLEGYIGTLIYAEALRHVDFPPKPEAVMRYLETLKDYDFKGIKLSFDPEKRRLSNTLWLELGETDWKEVAASRAPILYKDLEFIAIKNGERKSNNGERNKKAQ